MKILKSMLCGLFALSLLAAPAFAGDSCCEKAKKDGKDCAHKCCVEAKAAGKACEKCAPKDKK